MIQSQGTFQSGLDQNPKLGGIPPDYQHTQSAGSNPENYAHISKIWIMDDCLCLKYWLQVVMDHRKKSYSNEIRFRVLILKKKGVGVM